MTANCFSSEIESNYPYLNRFARKLTGSEYDAQDLVQNTALRAYKKRDQLDEAKNFRPWAARILYHTFVSEFQKKKRRQELISRNGRGESFFYNVSRSLNFGYDDLKVADLLSIAKETGKKSYEAFELFLFGYSYDEIAAKLDIAIGTVKSRINFVRSKLRSRHNDLRFSDN